MELANQPGSTGILMTKNPLSRRDFLKTIGGVSFASISSWNTRFLSDKPAPSTSLPNILIIVFDTLSARHLSVYNYPRFTTPNLERFATRATVYHHHYAGGNFTSPGTASLLTGVLPWSHRALRMHGQVAREYATRSLFHLLSQYQYIFTYTHNPLVQMLLNDFKGAIHDLVRPSTLSLRSDSPADQWLYRDYNTAYIGELLTLRNGDYPTSTLYLSLFDKLGRNLQQHYFNSIFHDRFPWGVPNFLDEQPPSFMHFTVEEAIDWLRNLVISCPRPFLGYVHLLPPHDPYITRREFEGQFQDNWAPPAKPVHPLTDGYDFKVLSLLRSYYDESILYIDAEFCRLIESLDLNSLLTNTYVIFTSDHGEMFERGIFRHNTPTLYDPVIHIPLIISKPGQTQRQDIYTPTSAVDVLPSLLSLTGQPTPDWCEGQVLPSFPGAVQGTERSIFVVEAKENSQHGPLRKFTLAMMKGRYKLIYYQGYNGYSDIYEMYDLEEDPEELVDIYATSPFASDLRAELQARLQSVNAGER